MKESVKKPANPTKPVLEWSSKFGFLMAAMGSAIGLGNLWRFPYLAGQNGGGIFVLIYVCATVFVALPILIAELMLGRAGRVTPVMAIGHLVRENKTSSLWRFIGWGCMLCAVLLLSYYSVIGGWTLRYVFSALSGSFWHIDQGHAASLFQDMIASPLTLIFYHSLFILLSMLIVVGGVQKGIEKSSIIMMPLLLIVLVSLVIYASFMPGFAKGARFMLAFDPKHMSVSSCLSAIGQAFFALSVGIGAMMTYGSYLSKSADIVYVSFKIAFADTLVAILAGLAIFPIVFTYSLTPTEGPGLTFMTLPIAFGQMPGGRLFATSFFILLVLAAVSSSISVLETFVSFFVARFSMSRIKATWISGFAVWALGLLTVFSFNILSTYHPLGFFGISGTFFTIIDFFVSNILLLGIGLSIALYTGWALKREATARYLNLDQDSWRFRLWHFCVRVVAPLGILAAFIFESFLTKAS